MKQQVHGNVTGVRDTLIEALGQLYDYEVDEDTFLPHELMQVLARFTGVLNREIAVYITRDGEVVDVSIGTDRDVELRDYRLRRNTQRLSCVRCIHTHPNGDGRLSDVDLSALRSFRYDAMVAIGCLKGEPTFVQSAFLVEKQNLLMDEPVRWYKTPDGDWMRQITESDRIVGWEADEKGTHAKERAVLMGIESMESLDELARLADTAGAEVVGQFLQKKDKPDTALFIGRGRADELCRQCQALEADLCIFDEELTGIQARNLEEILRVKVVDRTTLILDIFAQRASSAEGKLQVELAQLQYQSSRLIGQGLVLSRLAGGEEMQVVDTEQIYTGAQGIKAKIPAGYTLLEETVQPETDETYAYYGFDTYNDRIGYSLGKVVDMIPEEITSVDEISDHCASRWFRASTFWTQNGYSLCGIAPERYLVSSQYILISRTI